MLAKPRVPILQIPSPGVTWKLGGGAVPVPGLHTLPRGAERIWDRAWDPSHSRDTGAALGPKRRVRSLTLSVHPQGQGDLLKNAKSQALENMKQIQLACLSCGLSKSGPADAKSKRGLEAIQEKDTGDENGRL